MNLPGVSDALMLCFCQVTPSSSSSLALLSHSCCPSGSLGFLPLPQSSSPSSGRLLWEILPIKAEQRWEKKEEWKRGAQAKRRAAGKVPRKGEWLGRMSSDAAVLGGEFGPSAQSVAKENEIFWSAEFTGSSSPAEPHFPVVLISFSALLELPWAVPGAALLTGRAPKRDLRLGNGGCSSQLLGAVPGSPKGQGKHGSTPGARGEGRGWEQRLCKPS